MTPKERVLETHPHAVCTDCCDAFRVWQNSKDAHPIGEGSNARAAWLNAALRLPDPEVVLDEVPESPKVAQGAAKTPLALIPPVAADAIAKVHQHGADRYSPWNWRESKVPMMTYLHAMRRHLDAVLDGQDLDPDSGLPHVAHVAASCNIIMDAAAFGTLVDDRPRARPL
jgi:hypothetical protein